MIFSTLPKEAESHSWVECLDWKFKDTKKWSWLEKDGRCEGYARRFPVGEKPFSKLDNNSPHRHFEQKHDNPESQPSCSNSGNGMVSGTFDETCPAHPRKPTKERARKASSTVQCPSRRLNHQGDSDASPVYVGLSGLNPKKDYTQKAFSSNRIATLDYSNCASGGNSDLKPCGGCFNLPKSLQVGSGAGA
ncbi:MAG: hypothetical protein J3Q66DRAFT_408867 [Benniella sp.]|nr:MAG: hypothetical protein J3Q66DRAFT_408867 [Benniella sp.]